MKIIIRADASVKIGSGHIMRCLTIAHNFQKRGHEVLFFMSPLEGNLISYVTAQGFQTITSWQSADIILIDHYQIDFQLERSLRKYANKIVVIDDLANRKHVCDVLLDQNIVENYQYRYDDLVPKTCKKLLGPQYLIMRDEFIQARQAMPKRTGKVEHLLVFMGGTDPTHETLKILEALKTAPAHFQKVHIVCGNGNVQKEEIQAICHKRGYPYHQQIDYMARLMNEVDFSIGAGGLTTWERCYVGLPSSSTIVADNQYETTKMTEKLGAVINVGWHEKVTVGTYQQLFDYIVSHPEHLKSLSKKGLALTESQGRPNPWIDEILELKS